ncbi:expressed unknown protein [Seminavis robusta]|uniref:SGNH hydrolase-type esterase domain-containing protein n=1 Tax=Seminavis robusta TaxID=568900 RepID=A0A9N8DCW0_9STRA|nr:expressed unknown protein [Seminavis robusta]|eukprot:Sro65_g036770.1 n/a (571) ;mRNA; r:69766-71575
MKKQSSKLLLFLVLELASRNATNAFLATKPPSRRGHVVANDRVVQTASSLASPTRFTANNPIRSQQSHLYFDLASVLDPVSLQDSLPPVLQQLSQTLFFQPTETLSTARMIQTAGEASFAGLFAIAAVQGALVMRQYQTNPNGGLIVPPGLTVGDEDATKDTIPMDFAAAAPMTNGVAALKAQTVMTDEEIQAMVCNTEDTELSCAMKKQWYHITTQVLAVALIPLAAVAAPSMGLASFFLRFEHIMHLAVMFGLTHVYDFFRKLPSMETLAGNIERPSVSAQQQEPMFSGDHPRVMVLGDSMCVGIGTCEVFDGEKVYDIPLHKEEHLADTPDDILTSASPGPVFPKILAKTLSQRLQKPVAWRSAGVDGGSTLDIAEHLLEVVQDEVDQDKAPDLVVVLTGSNDLKHLLDGSASVKGFRSNLMDLAKQIQTISPKTRVVFPALPTYRMDQKSILNVFPLSVFLDSFMGVWDAQKMTVADQCPGVMHVDLTVKDVNSWYQKEEGEEPVSLIAADGIHPNARCYAKWGAFVGNSLADQISNESVSEPSNFVMNKPSHQEQHFAGGFGIRA